MKKAMQTAAALLSAAALLAACDGAGKTGNKGSGPPPALPGQAEIAYVTFSLPEQVRWQQNEDPAVAQAGVSEWYLAGTSSQTSPARVMYQKLMPAQSSANVRAQILKPLESCVDSAVSGSRTGSKYNRQLNFEAVCSKFGEANFGWIQYVSILTDGAANHLVMTEVRTPPSQQAGTLAPGNAEERQWADTSRQLADLMRNTIQSIRVCDAANNCQ